MFILDDILIDFLANENDMEVIEDVQENIDPYPNEHAARVKSPGLFQTGSFRRKVLPGSGGVAAVMGRLKGETTMTIQAYRFPIGKFTAAEAKAWLTSNKVKYMSFEAAAPKKDSEDINTGRKKICSNAVINSLAAGKIKKGTRCAKCGVKSSKLEAHHPSYANGHELDIIWVCASCHAKLHAKDSADTHTVTRYDFLGFAGEGDTEMVHSLKETNEGYLSGRAVVTNVGVFPYIVRDNDGSVKVVRELRTPEEVSNTDSIQSLRMIPLTNEHPDEAVNIENIKDVQVGFTGDKILWDQYRLSVPVTITDKQAVMDIKSGKRGLSCGYKVDIEETSGNWLGTQYDVVQRNIRYNHIAIVDRGRAGDDARLKLDSIGDSIGILKTDELPNNISIGGISSMNLKKINIDGIVYEAEANVIDAYTEAKSKLEQLQKDSKEELTKAQDENAKITGERDQLKADKEKVDKELEELKKVAPNMINEAVKARIALLDAATKAEAEIKDEMTDLEIKKTVILKVSPEANLDDKDEAYINARFDVVVETLSKAVADSEANRIKLAGDSIGNKAPEKDDVLGAYKRMVASQQDAWKQKEVING